MSIRMSMLKTWCNIIARLPPSATNTESISIVSVCAWEETIYGFAGHVKSMTNQYGEQAGDSDKKLSGRRYASMSFTQASRDARTHIYTDICVSFSYMECVYLHLYWILTCTCVCVCVCVVVMCTRSHKCQTMWVTIINAERTANTSSNTHEGGDENKKAEARDTSL